MKNGKQKTRPKIGVERSSGNIFRDLELDDPDLLLAKSKVILEIRKAQERKCLADAAAAKLIGISNKDLKAILGGDLDRFPLDELEAFRDKVELEASNEEGTINMKKVPLSDGSGHWFDLASAKEFHENVSTDEMVHRGFRDGDWEYGETLYYTKKGTFVLCHWTRKHDTLYFPIDTEGAVRWLIANGYEKDVQQLEFQSEERKLEV